MTENQHTQNLNAIAQDIDALAKQAYREIIARIGTAPASVIIKEVLKGYTQAVQTAVDSLMTDYLSLGTQTAPLAKVGKITLSQALYANASLAVTPVVTRLINESAQQITTARELSRLIYDGYNFQDDPLKVQKELPKYLVGNLKKSIAQAKTLKTPHLKAAYLQALGRIEKGAHQDALNKALQVAFYERNRYLANRIAQTELHRVHTDTIASEMMADNELHWVQVKMSGTHPKYDICDYHSSLNAYGKGAGVYPKAKAPKPPYHPHCLVGDSFITSSDLISAVSKRWFSGNVVTITTARGNNITVTENHPILTVNGFIHAHLLNIGDNVGHSLVSNGVVVSYHDNKLAPTSISEIFNSFGEASSVTTTKVPTTAPDFHGDGIDGDVAIINTDGKLWDWVKSSIEQSTVNDFFILTHCAEFLLRDGILNLCLKSFFSSPNGFVRFFCEFAFLFRREFSHSDYIGFRAISDSDSFPFNNGYNSRAGDVALFGDLKDRNSIIMKLNNLFNKVGFVSLEWSNVIISDLDSFFFNSFANRFSTNPVFCSDFFNRESVNRVIFDNIVNIKKSYFSGHVYNLDVVSGYYSCNGIITHNCRCKLSNRYDLDEPIKPPLENKSAQREFINSLPKGAAIAILGSEAKYFNYRTDKGLTVLDIVDNGKPEGYETRFVGDVKPAIMVGMKKEISFAPRTNWNKDFPRVVFASSLGSAEKHNDYVAAKSGDILAAVRLVGDLVGDVEIERIAKLLNGSKPHIVPVLAIEATGRNMIPNAYANKIATALGLNVSYDIVQSEKVARTGKGSDYRLAYSPKFDGEVSKTDYLIVDDTMTMGGTLANLKGYIEANGGKVISASTLTGFGGDGVLALSDKMRENLWKKHGKELDDYLKEQFGYGIDSLTQGEAGHYRKANTVDEIRARIAATRNEKSGSGG